MRAGWRELWFWWYRNTVARKSQGRRWLLLSQAPSRDCSNGGRKIDSHLGGKQLHMHQRYSDCIEYLRGGLVSFSLKVTVQAIGSCLTAFGAA